MITNPFELFPCPFCGGAAQTDNLYDNDHFGIRCKQCGAEAKKPLKQYESGYSREQGKENSHEKYKRRKGSGKEGNG